MNGLLVMDIRDTERMVKKVKRRTVRCGKCGKNTQSKSMKSFDEVCTIYSCIRR